MTLQVSLGSNDEFFAFDKFGKVSSRDDEIVSRNSSPPTTRRESRASSALDLYARKSASTLSNHDLSEGIGDYFEPKQDISKVERRRSVMVGGVPLRMSWPDKKTLLMAKARIQTQGIEERRTKAIYVDAGVQTESMNDESCYIQRPRGPPRTHSLPLMPYPIMHIYEFPRHPVGIGLMQELCRKQQYRLGDALQHV